MDIRPATASDIDALMTLQRRGRQWAWNRQVWQEEVRRKQGLVWVVERGSEQGIDACLVAWRGVDAVEIVDLVVDPGARRQSIASTMVQTLIVVAAAYGAQRIRLEVRDSNRGAIEFYQTLGFHFVGRQSGYYADGADAEMMEFRIARS